MQLAGASGGDRVCQRAVRLEQVVAKPYPVGSRNLPFAHDQTIVPCTPLASQPVRIGIIGAGAVSDYHHVPAIRLDPRAKLVAACDTNRELLAKRKSDWSIDIARDRSGGDLHASGTSMR